MFHLFTNVQNSKQTSELAGMLLPKGNTQAKNASGLFKSFVQQLLGKSTNSDQLSETKIPLTVQMNAKQFDAESMNDWNRFQSAIEKQKSQEGAFCFIGDPEKVVKGKPLMKVIASDMQQNAEITKVISDNMQQTNKTVDGHEQEKKVVTSDQKLSKEKKTESIDEAIIMAVVPPGDETSKQMAINQKSNSELKVVSHVASESDPKESLKLQMESQKVIPEEKTAPVEIVSEEMKPVVKAEADHAKVSFNEVVKKAEQSEKPQINLKLDSEVKAGDVKPLVEKKAEQINEKTNIAQNNIKSTQDVKRNPNQIVVDRAPLESTATSTLKSVLSEMEPVTNEETNKTAQVKDASVKSKVSERTDGQSAEIKVDYTASDSPKKQDLNAFTENTKSNETIDLKSEKTSKGHDKFSSHLKSETKETTERPVGSDASNVTVENKADIQSPSASQTLSEKVNASAETQNVIEKQAEIKTVNLGSSAASSQTRTSQFNMPELRENVMQQVVPNLTRMLRRGSSRVRIALRPQELGELKVDVLAQKGVVTARFQVENEEVRSVVENSLPELKAVLEKNGVQVDQLQVQVNKEFTTFSNQSQNSSKSYTDHKDDMNDNDASQHKNNPNQEKQEERQFGYNSREFVA